MSLLQERVKQALAEISERALTRRKGTTKVSLAELHLCHQYLYFLADYFEMKRRRSPFFSAQHSVGTPYVIIPFFPSQRIIQLLHVKKRRGNLWKDYAALGTLLFYLPFHDVVRTLGRKRPRPPKKTPLFWARVKEAPIIPIDALLSDTMRAAGNLAYLHDPLQRLLTEIAAGRIQPHQLYARPG